MKKSTRKTGLILSILVSGTLIGYMLGRYSSPDASKPATARWAVVMYGKWQRIDQHKGRLSLRAGGRTYSWSTGDAKVQVKYLSAKEIAASPPPTYDYDSDLEKFLTLAVAPPVETGIWASISEVAGKAEVITLPERILLAVVTLGGGALGYYVGHKSEPDYDNPKFEEELERNAEFWGQMEGDFQVEYELTVNKLLLEMLNQDRTAKGEKERTRMTSPSKGPGPNDSSGKFRNEFLSHHPEISEQAWQDPVIEYELKYQREGRSTQSRDTPN